MDIEINVVCFNLDVQIIFNLDTQINFDAEINVVCFNLDTQNIVVYFNLELFGVIFWTSHCRNLIEKFEVKS